MLARFEFDNAPKLFRLESKPIEKPMGSGRLLIVLLTAVYLLWLFVRIVSQPAWLLALPALLDELLRLAELAGLLTLGLLWSVLWWHGRQDQPHTIQPLDREKLYSLDPYDFERYVAALFRSKGYRVQLRGRSGDAGVDLMLTQRGGKRAIVQCKRYRRPIGPDIVRELYGTLIHERVSHAFLVTTADISDSAREWAQGKPITLVDGDSLALIAAVLDEKPA
jgi:restriction system protein